MTIEEGMRCTDCVEIIEKSLMIDCEDCGAEWVAEDYEISLIGNDVKALFPAVELSKSTAKQKGEKDDCG